MADTAYQPMSQDAFLAWAEGREGKFELVDGLVVELMTGAQRRHDRVVVNCIVALGSQLAGKPCQVNTDDLAVKIGERTVRRPDVLVDCGPTPENALYAHAPVFVLEVLSPSTRKSDQTRKANEYKTIATLRYILILEPDMPKGAFYFRADDAAWIRAEAQGLDAALDLPAIGASLRFSDLYRGLPAG